MKLNSARNNFFQAIGSYMEEDDIYIVSADLAGPPFDAIRAYHPNRYVSVGIAEQNMISVALGLALAGKKTIAYTSNPFIAFRAFDQIRNGLSMMHLPLTIVGVGTGFSISEYGTTHFVTEDVAMMSLCPGLKQITISDDTVADSAVNYVRENHGPLYLRFDKECGGTIGGDKPDIETGFRQIYSGKTPKVTLVTQGYLSQVVSRMDWSNEPVEIYDVYTNPFNYEAFLRKLNSDNTVIVCEEQQLRGGLGSIILEAMNDAGRGQNVVRMGVAYKNAFPEAYGTRNYWLEHYQISEDAIRNCVNSVLNS